MFFLGQSEPSYDFRSQLLFITYLGHHIICQEEAAATVIGVKGRSPKHECISGGSWAPPTSNDTDTTLLYLLRLPQITENTFTTK